MSSMVHSMQTVRSQAVEALRSVLQQVSQIKLNQLDVSAPHPDLKVDILAHISVHGHSHTLVCKVRASGRPDHVRMALEEFQGDSAQFSSNATPVFIAPYLPEESKALCWESKAGFLDLEGNARLDLGEVFIGTRSSPQIKSRPVSSVTGRRREDQALDHARPEQIAGAA
jgi:hypothetical protein